MQRYNRSFTHAFQLSRIAARCSAAIGSGPQCWQRSRCCRTCFVCLGGSILKATPGVGVRAVAEFSRRMAPEAPSRLVRASPLEALGVLMRPDAAAARCDGRGVAAQPAAPGPESLLSGGAASCSSALPALCALAGAGVVWRGVAGTMPLADRNCAPPRLLSVGCRMRLSGRAAGAGAAATTGSGTDPLTAGPLALSIRATWERKASISAAISFTMEDSKMLCSSNCDTLPSGAFSALRDRNGAEPRAGASRLPRADASGRFEGLSGILRSCAGNGDVGRACRGDSGRFCSGDVGRLRASPTGRRPPVEDGWEVARVLSSWLLATKGHGWFGASLRHSSSKPLCRCMGYRSNTTGPRFGEGMFLCTSAAKNLQASCRTPLSESSAAGNTQAASVGKNLCAASGQLSCTCGRSSVLSNKLMASFLAQVLLLFMYGRNSSKNTSKGIDQSNCSTLSMTIFGFQTLLSRILTNAADKSCLASLSNSLLKPLAMRAPHFAASVSTGMLLSCFKIRAKPGTTAA
mmetsp:Transcript_68753/g.212599  ORF Transcript_68753/g.212599 Transcript_68753/m.212599 type:complete len:519 (-) Transcript_68753:1168-2724(-)